MKKDEEVCTTLMVEVIGPADASAKRVPFVWTRSFAGAVSHR